MPGINTLRYTRKTNKISFICEHCGDVFKSAIELEYHTKTSAKFSKKSGNVCKVIAAKMKSSEAKKGTEKTQLNETRQFAFQEHFLTNFLHTEQSVDKSKHSKGTSSIHSKIDIKNETVNRFKTTYSESDSNDKFE